MLFTSKQNSSLYCFKTCLYLQLYCIVSLFMFSKETDEDSRPKQSARQKAKVRKQRSVYGGESSSEEQQHRQNMTTWQKYGPASSSRTSCSPSKRRRMATRNQPDLTYCEWVGDSPFKIFNFTIFFQFNSIGCNNSSFSSLFHHSLKIN